MFSGSVAPPELESYSKFIAAKNIFPKKFSLFLIFLIFSFSKNTDFFKT